ncbi:MAG: response regulator [Betaproteobacteria bacterium]
MQSADVLATQCLRIVLADDEPDTVLTLAEVLRDEGHEVYGFGTGREAVAAARMYGADVLIVDIQMPDMTGYDIARQARHNLQRRALLIAISLKILVADDDADSVASLTALFETEGHAVRGVQRSADVLGAEREFRPDVVILDLHMPEIRGYDLARWLCSRYGRRCPLLIAVSGVYTRESDKSLFLTTGFDHFVTKPYYIGDLLRNSGQLGTTGSGSVLSGRRPQSAG